MNEIFDIKKFYENIFHVIYLKKLKIGEIEMNNGLQKGYLSRRRKDLKPLSVDKAFSICQQLGYTIEELSSMDMEKQLIKQEIAILEEEIEKLRRQVE